MSQVTTNTQIDTINILQEASSANATDYFLLQRGSVSYKIQKSDIILPINQLNDISDLSVLGNVSGGDDVPSEITIDTDLSGSFPNHNSIPSSRAVKSFFTSPGLSSFETSGTFEWPENINYVKVYVTGSGSRGPSKTGGAGATVIGYISNDGNDITVTIGAAPITDNTNGNSSSISINATTLLLAEGGIPSATASGTITVDSRIHGAHIILGGGGNVDTDRDGSEESEGAASYWGSPPCYGAGSSAHANATVKDAGDGFVMFEWN